MFNFTDSRIGDIGRWNTQLLRVNDNTLAVVDPMNYRIILLDLDNGDFFGHDRCATEHINAERRVRWQTAWYRSEVTYDVNNGYQSYNASIRQYATDGSVLAEYTFGNHEVYLLSIGGDGWAHRLYALDPI